MASVSLKSGAVGKDSLPPLCIKCGGPVEHWCAKTFFWMPWWKPMLAVPVGVVAVPLGFVSKHLYTKLMQSITQPKQTRVDCPLCSGHRDHWRSRQIFQWSGIILLIIIVVLAELLIYSDGGVLRDKSWPPSHERFYVCIAVGFCAYLAAVLGLHLTSVRAAEITDSTITITGVSPAFAEAIGERGTKGRKGSGSRS